MNDAKPDHLKTHFLPVIVKLKERAEKVFEAEGLLKKEHPMGGNEMEEAEFALLEVIFHMTLSLYHFLLLKT